MLRIKPADPWATLQDTPKAKFCEIPFGLKPEGHKQCGQAGESMIGGMTHDCWGMDSLECGTCSVKKSEKRNKLRVSRLDSPNNKIL